MADVDAPLEAYSHHMQLLEAAQLEHELNEHDWPWAVKSTVAARSTRSMMVCVEELAGPANVEGMPLRNSGATCCVGTYKFSGGQNK